VNRLCTSEVRGYAGTIRLLVLPEANNTAQNSEHKTITAVRVISHSETPGIGDFIELDKSNWILNFNSLILGADVDTTVNRMQVQLDAVTGATITRRAIINGVAKSCLN